MQGHNAEIMIIKRNRLWEVQALFIRDKANEGDVTFLSCLSHQAEALTGSTVEKMRGEREPHPAVESLLSFCYCGKMRGWNHKLAECSKNLWEETAKSQRDIRIHFSYEMPHDTACKQIICMWGNKTTGSQWLWKFETNASTNTPYFNRSQSAMWSHFLRLSERENSRVSIWS